MSDELDGIDEADPAPIVPAIVPAAPAVDTGAGLYRDNSRDLALSGVIASTFTDVSLTGAPPFISPDSSDG